MSGIAPTTGVFMVVLQRVPMCRGGDVGKPFTRVVSASAVSLGQRTGASGWLLIEPRRWGQSGPGAIIKSR